MKVHMSIVELKQGLHLDVMPSRVPEQQVRQSCTGRLVRLHEGNIAQLHGITDTKKKNVDRPHPRPI